MSNLTGKVALVTGASKGIGAAIAKELAARGAAVAVNYASDKAGADKTVAAIEAAGGKAIAIHATVTDEAAVKALAATTAEKLGPIDILVNNAGVYEFAPLEQITVEHYRKQFDVNVLGLLLVTREAVARFNPAGGSIVNIGSVVGKMASSGGTVYSATKGAVDTITVALSKELGPKKIRVNALNPGLVITEGTKSVGVAGSDMEKAIVAVTPLGRAGQPEDIAKAAAFLAGEDAGWVTGQTIYASGGTTM